MKNIVEKLITKSFRRLLDKGNHRGFITYEELGKSLGKRHYSQKNIEEALLHIFDKKVCLVEKKSDYRSTKKKESTSADSNKNVDLDKSDDPIRMYLREMGGVDLLSREGEIAIAKRIEAGKDYMMNGLFQSPLTAQKIFEWREQLEKNELLIREIIDIDSSYGESESENEDENQNSKKNKQNKKKELNYGLDKTNKNLPETEKNNTSKDPKNQEYIEEDEFNLSLAAMEEEIKPQVISTVNVLCKDYTKLIKLQNEKLNYALDAQQYPNAKEKNYQKIQNIIVNKIKTLQLNASVLENLVETHYQQNQKIISLEGILMRMAGENKISRDEFLRNYLGNEINPNFETSLNEKAEWKNFFKKKKKEFFEIKERLIEFSKKRNGRSKFASCYIYS